MEAEKEGFAGEGSTSMFEPSDPQIQGPMSIKFGCFSQEIVRFIRSVPIAEAIVTIQKDEKDGDSDFGPQTIIQDSHPQLDNEVLDFEVYFDPNSINGPVLELHKGGPFITRIPPTRLANKLGHLFSLNPKPSRVEGKKAKIRNHKANFMSDQITEVSSGKRKGDLIDLFGNKKARKIEGFRRSDPSDQLALEYGSGRVLFVEVTIELVSPANEEEVLSAGRSSTDCRPQ
ncbi:hypothetical protein QYF36_008192 [Acer negundo]|nr:hypothetical protein QYF36_008192 [Acer negundo]